MRIAQIAPPDSKLCGGAERVVSWLTEEQLRRGHYVALFSSGDSITGGAQGAPWPPLRFGRPQATPGASRPKPGAITAYSMLLETLRARAEKFDVIHCHVDSMHLPLLRRFGKPFLATLYNGLDAACLSVAACQSHGSCFVSPARHFPGAGFVSTSNSQRAGLPELNWIGTIHHGIPAGALTPRFKSGRYLALLGGRREDQEFAIRCARAAGMPLRIAATVADDDKQEFLGNAAALLFPSDWPGLVMMEAMACGTPVIAWRSGSASEVIDDGVTGFIFDNKKQAVGAVRHVRELDRRAVRDTFDRRFTARRMAHDYLSAYHKLTGAKKQDRDGVLRSTTASSSALAVPASTLPPKSEQPGPQSTRSGIPA
jgi:glycosyltransferase involved in cell wall biosynthesis